MAKKRRKTQTPEEPRRSSGAHVAVKVLLVVFVMTVLSVGGLAVYVYSLLGNMQFTPDDLRVLLEDALKDTATPEPDDVTGLEELSENELSQNPQSTVEVAKQVKSIKNYLLFGVDSRETDGFTGLSDVMIIVTVDTKNNAVKLTSIMRDTLVAIEGHGNNKLNTAFRFLGPDGAVDVIESLTGIPIDGYGIMNFYTVGKVIDIVGGVDIEDLSSAEKESLNSSIQEQNKYTDEQAEYVKATGAVHLTGPQAVAYMRIRHVGHDDFERTQRQRTVISTLFTGLKQMNLATMLSLVTQVTPYVKTDLSESEIIALAKSVYDLRRCEVQQLRLPIEDSYKLIMYNNMSCIRVDVEANAQAVKEFIYGS